MSLRTLGDVIARQGPCLSVTEDASARDLASVLVKHRVDAIVVLTSDNALAGIATSRDVAKTIARNNDLDSITAAHVMTANPITLPPTNTPANALALMREGRFRHIPVVDGTQVLGVVDVLSLAYDAITRLQVSYNMIPTRRAIDLMRAARDNIEKPTLRPILQGAKLATLSRTDTVAKACETIATHHVAAIVIVDEKGILDGIFTCTDLIKRVVAKQRDPTQVLLADVMTSNPDSAGPDFTILESLQRMQACGFRHLPVVEDESRVVVGVVDVLQLASDTLLDMRSIANRSPSPTRRGQSRARSPARLSKQESFNSTSSGRGQGRGIVAFFGGLFSNSFGQRAASTNDDVPSPVHVNAAMPAQRHTASLGWHTTGIGGPSGMPMRADDSSNTRRHYSYLGSERGGRGRHARGDVPLASFKFKDMNQEYRRIKVPMELEKGDYDQFLLDVRRRFAGSSRVGAVKIKYVDEDGDDVVIANDDDLASCFEEFVDKKNKTIHLKVSEANNSKIQSPISSAPSSVMGSPTQSCSSGRQVDLAPLKTTVEPPPVEHPYREPDKPTGVYRTVSKSIIHTPSSLKAQEGHKQMLDGNVEDAIALFNEALSLDPENARALGERAAARLLGGNSVQAEEDYRAAIRLLKDGKGGKKGDLAFQMCIVGLVEALIDQRRYEEGVTVGGEIKAEWGNNGCVDAFRDELDSASAAARQALEAGDFGDAMSCFTNALRVESGYLKLVPGESARSSLRLGRAKCYKAMEDYDMALEDYEAAVKIEPESVAGHKGCGKCLAELEQMERALEAYERAHKLDGGDEEVSKEMETIKKMMADPMQGKKEEIAKLGALLGSMKLPGKG